MGKGFRFILAVAVISIFAGGAVGAGRPAAAGEISPQTEKLFRAVRSNNFPAVKRNLLDGGNVRAENAAGLTVIDLAIDKGYFNIAHYLLAWRKQRKPKIKPPLPIPEPLPETAEAAPGAEPAPPGQAREAVPIARKPPEPLPGAESAAKPAPPPTPTPIETAPKPGPLPEADPVPPGAAKTAEKAAEIPPPAPAEPRPAPTGAAATEPSSNKTLTPAPAESPGILGRITGFFTSDPEPEPKAPDPKPVAEESPTAPVKAVGDKPETQTEQAAAPSAIAAPEEEKAPEGSSLLDQVAGFFTSDPEPEKKAPDPKPMAEESPPPPVKAVGDKPEKETEQATAGAIAAPGVAGAPPAIKKRGHPVAPEEEKAAEGPGAFDQIARFFSSETEPKDQPASPSEAKPEPAAKAAVEETPKPLPEPEKTPPAEPVREAVEKPTPMAPEKPEDRADIIARIQDLLSTGPEKDSPRAPRLQETASIPTPTPASRPKPIPEPVAPPSPTVPKTTSFEPFIGTSMKLGKRWRKDTENICVDKRSRKILFCIEPVDWPPEIGPSFQVHTTLYRGRKSIVRYDGEVATQFHALFPTGNFDAIVEHFSELFGPPTENPVIWTVMIGKPNRKNRTARWVGPPRTGGGNGDRGTAPGILDVREIDDLRWSSPPDDRHGVVWLYRKGGEPVFQHISWSDFLLARVRRQRN